MRTVIFDLDGTLVESAPDIHAAANLMLNGEGIGDLDLDTVRSFIGNGVPRLVERVMERTGIDIREHGRLVESFTRHYEAAPANRTVLFPNARAVIEQLSAEGVHLGICTNKPERPSRAILDALGVARYFGAVVGGDSLATRKPDAAPLRETMRRLGAASGIYVGDSEVDAETSTAAGLPFLLFTRGYRQSPIESLRHDAAFDDFALLPGLLDAAFAELT